MNQPLINRPAQLPLTPVPLSLVHRVQPPTVAPDEGRKPPLLLLLHGVGSNENDLMGLAPHLDGRFLIVSARSPRTLSPGAYGWYPVVFTPQGATGDTREVEAGRQILLGFIAEVAKAYGADPDRVYLMGFSQGAIMSLFVALTHPELIAGGVLMSGRLLEEAWTNRAGDDALRGLPLLVVHGTRDTVLPVAGARQTREHLTTVPVSLTYQEFGMAHEVSRESLSLVNNWLRTRLDV